MQDELLRIQEVVHKTMIFITHDFLEAIKMGDHIAIMKDGGFVQVDTPEAVVAHPADDYVRDFTEDVPRYKVLTARTVMRDCALVVSDTEDVGAVLAKMEGEARGTVFVTGEGGRFLGAVPRRAVERAAAEGAAEVGDLARNGLPTVSPETKLDALIPIAAGRDDLIPVVDGSERLLGSIDRAGVLLALESKR